MKKIKLLSFVTLLIASCSIKSLSQTTRSFVPNDTTAIKIAEAVWWPIYGADILMSKPYRATLQGDTLWIVKGTLKPIKEHEDGSIEITVGGIPYAHIRKEDGKIIKVYHTR